MSGLRSTIPLLLLVHFAFVEGRLLAQHPVWQHYAMNEGLFSQGVYAMLQDSRGYLWFGTSQGICRFNGYEFSRPTDTSAAATSEALYITQDSQGRIWFNRLDGKLWMIENDSVRAWPYNHLLKSFFKDRTTHRFAVSRDGAVWVSSWVNGILMIKPDGSHQIISGQDRNAIIFSEIDGNFLCSNESNQNIVAEEAHNARTHQTNEILRWQEGKGISLGRFPVDYLTKNGLHGFSIWPLGNNFFISNYLHTYYILQGNRLIWHGQKDGTAKNILENTDGSILMAMLNGPNAGLLRFRSIEHFKRNEFENLLPGKPVTQVLRDREGGWWVSTLNAGVFYCKNPDLGLFDHTNGLPASEVSLLTYDGAGNIYAGLRQRDIAVFKRDGGYPELLPPPPINEMQALRFDTLSGRLWAANNLCYFEKKRWNITQRQDQIKVIHQPIYVKRFTPDFSGNVWWVSSVVGVISIDLLATSVNCNPLDSFPPIRTYSVSQSPDSILWITTMEGLRFWRDGHFLAPLFSHPALRFNPQNVEVLPSGVGGGQVISLNGGGLLIRDTKGQFTHLTTKDGLTANMLNELDISPEGVIYACSNAGLNILSRQKNGKWHIEILSSKHGLPSDQINDVLLIEHEVWIATDGGIVRFLKKRAPAPMPAPILENFVINNRPSLFSENLSLSHNQNNLTIRFFSLHYRSSGEIPYRYRLLGGDTSFVYSHTREVNFANLSPSQYTFEVQAQNEDGQWSESSRWAFTILPPWWATWWFRALIGATLVVALYLFYQNRLQSIRREAAEREKIRELETAALRAQMNPHFIFNCLQAIQSYIVQNDRDAATTYLARFAKLVRLALHGSVDGHHSLAEEIAMLDNYLHLEQMRFRGKFEFVIRVEGLDLDEIILPPMLVQPFVENALIHGLQNHESGGRVEVIFAQKGNVLEVLVTDNGPGFLENETAMQDKAPHKSVGMMLTQKRLDLLMGGGKTGSDTLVRETVLDESGASQGARAQIFIPI